MDSSTAKRAGERFAIGQIFAGTHDELVADAHLLDGQIHLTPIAHDMGDAGAQARQPADRRSPVPSRASGYLPR